MNWTRRNWFRVLAGFVAGSIQAGRSWAASFKPRDREADKPASDAVVRGKSPGLIVHTVDPIQIETPPELLLSHEITPTNLVFVRNNLEIPNSRHTDSLPLAGWKIEFIGMVDAPKVIDASLLTSFPQEETTMVLQCSGNGRAFYSKAAFAKGEQWTRGAMANVRFSGVPLRSLVERLGIRIQPDARFMAAEGADQPAKPGEQDFEHSLPLDEALNRSMLALEMNGMPLPAVHGGPVRLVTPGYYATMHIKWVNRLRFEATESTTHHHLNRYRTPIEPVAPGASFNYTLENSKPNWRMRTKSVILSARRTSGRSQAAIEGVVFTDGTKVEAVLVSADRGATWSKARLAPLAAGERRDQAPLGDFAWRRWSIELPVPSDNAEVWSQATDAQGRSQPLDPSHDWNPDGYAYHSADRMPVADF